MEEMYHQGDHRTQSRAAGSCLDRDDRRAHSMSAGEQLALPAIDGLSSSSRVRRERWRKYDSSLMASYGKKAD